MGTSFYRSGDWNVICDICGRKVKRTNARLNWKRQLVCPRDWEPKHPQLFPSPRIRDGRPVKPARPEPADTFRTDVQTEWEEITQEWQNINCNWEDIDDAYCVEEVPGVDC